MNLIIDIGNSSVKYYYAGLEFRSLAELELNITQEFDLWSLAELNPSISQRAQLDCAQNPNANKKINITIISTVPKLNSQHLNQVEAWLAKLGYYQFCSNQAQNEHKTKQLKKENASDSKHYEIKIYNPLKDSSLTGLYPGIGADRVAKLDAAHRLFPDRDIVLFDFGTATTMSICNAAGEFLGGYIATGLELSLKALANCAELPDISAMLSASQIPDPNQLAGSSETPNEQNYGTNFGPAKSTKEAILSGAILAQHGLISAWLDAAHKISSNPISIASGGAARFFVERFDHHIPAAELLSKE